MATRKKTTSSRSTTRKAASRTTKKRNQKKSQELAFESEILLWILLAVSILLFVSNFGIGGKVGNAASTFMFGLFGVMAYIFPILLFIGSCFLISNKSNHFAIFKFIASILLFCALCLFLQLLVQKDTELSSGIVKNAYANSAAYKNGGGALGGIFVWLCVPNFGKFGSFVIDIVVMIISLVLITERSAILGMKRGGQKMYASAKEDARRYHENQQRRRVEQEERELRRIDKKVEGVAIDTKIGRQKKRTSDEINEVLPDIAMDIPEVKETEHISIPAIEPENADMPLPEIFIERAEEAASVDPYIPETEHDTPSSDPAMPEYDDAQMLESLLSDVGSFTEPLPEMSETSEEIVPEPLPASEVQAEPVMPEKPQKAEKTTPQENEKIGQEMQAAMEEKQPQNYVFPPVTLLKKGDPKAVGDSKAHLMETANKLQQTLKNFGVNVTITNVSSGPSVTRYEIQPEMGVKVSKIVNLTDDIKLNLAAADIRMEAPIPGKAAIGIEIPNKENVTVAFRDLIESEEFQKSNSKIAFAAGKDIGGQVVVTDIAKMPHLLIAGATGSGKSVCINTIIMSILYKAHPDDVKLIMVDPKVVELSVYNGIPHLLIPVVTDPKKAAGALNWAVAEMTDRYQKFAEYDVRNLKGYNEKVASISDIEDENKPKKMPQIVIIVDELADLMMVASNEVETAICRLAQLARAAGIHLIIATQRPSVNVITGLIKANMPSRVAFAVTSGVDSRTILDMNGAEKLLGKGDMLFFPQNYQKPLRVQGAFVSDKEVSDVVNFLKNQNGTTQYDPNIQEKMTQSENISMSISDSSNTADDKDVLFTDVGKFLIESEKGSIGSIQRRFKVGFNRAARIMDQLEEAGIVGPEEGTKPRKILMSMEEFEQYIEEYV